MTLLAEAVAWYQDGYTVVPTKTDRSKAPAVVEWRKYQTERPSMGETVDLFRIDSDGLGIITGTISRCIEMFELEGRAIAEGYADRLRRAFADHDQTQLLDKVLDGYAEQTPSAGIHWYYHVAGRPARNTKIARRPATEAELAVNPDEKIKTLIETRGEGGFSIVAGSGGRTHPSGLSWRILTGTRATIPTLSEDERDTLYAIASTLDEMPAVEPQQQRPASLLTLAGGLRPGDDYNARTTWQELLGPHGWKIHKHYGGNLYSWQRPGKRHPGTSATSGRNDADNLYVFSTSTEFDIEKPYSKFGAYALLEHGGDYAAAARTLRASGYGAQVVTPVRATSPAPRHLQPVSATPVEAEPEAEPTGEDFWAARPILTHLRQFAYARMCSPHALLGVTLLRALATVPPHVVLPPVIGGVGSLNLFVALVGSSGTGKGAAESAAVDALHGMGDIYTVAVGSGEGIAHQYAHREKGEVIYDRDAVLFSVPEVDTVAAIGGRQGSTLLSQLRSAFSGETLGYSYADPSRRLPINGHGYRLGMIVGVQPERAGPLLNDADGGTPQRFVWIIVTDRNICAEPPEQPEPMKITMPDWTRIRPNLNGKRIIPIPAEVTAELREQHAARARGEGDALDGHAMFAREKVAVAFAVLDGRHEMSLDDWQLAGDLMAYSDRTRDGIGATLAGMEARKRAGLIEMHVDRTVGADERARQISIERVADLTAKHLAELGGDAPFGTLRKRIALRNRDLFEYAVDRLVEAGLVTVEGQPRRVKVVPR